MNNNISAETSAIKRHNEIEREARKWLIYLYSDAADDSGRQKFHQWLTHSASHLDTYHGLEQMWRDLALIDNIEDMKSSREEKLPATRASVFAIFGARTRQFHPWRSALFGGAIAASLMLTIAIMFSHFYNPLKTAYYATGIGESNNIGLPDGSIITLGANSAIITHFSRHRREVALMRGDAYFDVAHDAGNVFKITVSNTEIRVFGTEFDVKKGPNDVRVSVAKGNVAVSSLQKPKSDQPVSSLIHLRAGEQVIAQMNGALGKKTSFNPATVFSWRKGRLVYVDVPLADVIADVNRYRKIPIRLRTKGLENIRVTTSFRAENSNQMLAGLAATEPVIIIDLGSFIMITPKSTVKNTL